MLKDVFRGELYHSRTGTSGGNASDCTRNSHVVVRNCEIHKIEKIEKLGAELQLVRLDHTERFAHGQVDASLAWPPEYVAG